MILRLLAIFALMISAAHAQNMMVNTQTGSTYTALNSDCDPQGRRITVLTNATSTAVRLPQPGVNGTFLGGCIMHFVNGSNTGVVSVTPIASTINGLSSATIAPGGSLTVYNDSTPQSTGNYWAGVAGGSVSAATLSVLSCPGIVANGVANDTTALVSCMASVANSSGGSIQFPNRKLLLDPFTLPPHVCLVGGENAPEAAPSSAYPVAPTLLVNSGGSTFISMSFGSCLKGLAIYYPGQVAPSASTPNTFPPTITVPASSNGGQVIASMTLVNSYQGINVNAGRTVIKDSKLSGFSYALNYDGAEDFSILSNNVIEPFWDTAASLGPDQPIDAWVRTNGTAIWMRRVDQLLITNLGVYGQGTCFDADDSALGFSPAPGFGLITNVMCDQVVHGIVAKSTQSTAHGYKFRNTDITGNGTGVGPSGVDALSTVAGGSLSPQISWDGGAAWATFSATRDMTLGAGNGIVTVTNVAGINPVGPITAPSFPGNAVSYTNAFGVNAEVCISANGATIAAIAIHGVATGLISGCFTLMSNEVITIGYGGGTPAWTWTGL